jgi:hypothetical protein
VRRLHACCRLNQDDDRDEYVQVAIEQCHLLLVVAAATSATGSLTKQVGTVALSFAAICVLLVCTGSYCFTSGRAAQEIAHLNRWKDRMQADQAFIICNKMNAIAQDPAPIGREEAEQLIFDHDRMFSNTPKDQRMTLIKSMTAHMSGPELDQKARKLKLADERPTRDQMMADVHGTTVQFTKPGPFGLSFGKVAADSNQQAICKIAPVTQVEHPQLKVGSVVTKVDGKDVSKQDADETLAELEAAGQSARRPFTITFDGLFPHTRGDSVHFVSANEALTAALQQLEGTGRVSQAQPKAFNDMRDVLFTRLKR